MAVFITLARYCIGYDTPTLYRHGLRLFIIWTPHKRKAKWPTKRPVKTT